MSALQLTVPKLKLTSAGIENYSKEYQIVYKPLAELNTLRPWYDVEFKEKEVTDFLSKAATESAIRKIIADTSQAGGVRVRFLPGSTCANLVEVLNIMNYTDQKKYWLDIRHQVLTLYAIMVRQEPRKNTEASAYLGCCTCGPYLPKPEAKAAWFLEFRNLWTKPWQPTVTLLALISILSLRPLLRRRLIFIPNHQSCPLCPLPCAAPCSTFRNEKKTNC